MVGRQDFSDNDIPHTTHAPTPISLLHPIFPSSAKTVYDTIVDHEAQVSHEAAISVARGGGIMKENLEAWNNV